MLFLAALCRLLVAFLWVAATPLAAYPLFRLLAAPLCFLRPPLRLLSLSSGWLCRGVAPLARIIDIFYRADCASVRLLPGVNRPLTINTGYILLDIVPAI